MAQRSLSEPAEQQNRVLLADSRQFPQEWTYQVGPASHELVQARLSRRQLEVRPRRLWNSRHPGSQVRTTEWNDSDIYLRKSFTLEGKLPAALALTVHHDEDCQVYLNGERIYEATGYLHENTKPSTCPPQR